MQNIRTPSTSSKHALHLPGLVGDAERGVEGQALNISLSKETVDMEAH